jgi:uncharacterized protein
MDKYSRIKKFAVYNDGENKIIIAPESATWLRCKPEQYRFLLDLPEYPKSILLDELQTKNRLIDQDEAMYLLSKYYNECFVYLNDQLNEDNYIQHPELSSINTVVFNITDSCNLRCKYCYADSTKGKNMSFEVIERTLKLVLDQTDLLNIQFTGNGEPLINYKVLIKSFDLVNKYRAKGKKIKISLQTNGTLISKEIAHVLRKEVDRTIVSIDGPEEITNDFRIHTNGEGAFNSIMNGIQILRDENVPHELSATIHNYDLFKPVCEWLIENSTGMFAHNYIWAQGRGKLYKTNGISKQKKWAGDHIWLMNRLIEHNSTQPNKLINRTIRQFVTNLVSRKRISKCHRSACGAGKELISVNAMGEIFPCHAMTTPPLKVGDLNELSHEDITVIHQNPMVESISKITVDNIEECRECEFKHVCGGTCCNDVYTRFKEMRTELPFECKYKKEFFIEIIKLISNDKHNLYHLMGLPISQN